MRPRNYAQAWDVSKRHLSRRLALRQQEPADEKEQRGNSKGDRANEHSDKMEQEHGVESRNQCAEENKAPAFRSLARHDEDCTEYEQVDRKHQPQCLEHIDQKGFHITLLHRTADFSVARPVQQSGEEQYEAAGHDQPSRDFHYPSYLFALTRRFLNFVRQI